ncbi:MAG: acetoacetate decarboxylase family protein [Promethearchaeota archaeon]
MVDYKRQINYSMPHQCGLFPPPPYKYPKMRAIVVIFQCAQGIKEKYLPPELEPIEYGFDSIFISEYPDSTIGPYNENLILLNCKYKNNLGSFVFNIYVDSDEALTAGREIWGYPKKMCEIYLSPIQDNIVRGTLTRKGMTFLDIEVELMDQPPGMDPKAMIENMPLYNLKIIPDVADNTKPLVRQLTETNMKYEEFYKKFGAKTNYIKSQYSQYDICHEILKDANKNLGGFYIECDQILPNGRVLE